MRNTAVVAIAVALAACSPKPVAPDRAFHERIAAIGAKFEQLPRLDEPCRLAMLDCMPALPEDSRRRASASTAASGEHAHKLYNVRASDESQLRSANAPIGLVVVKEAWVADEVTADEAKSALASNALGAGCSDPPFVHIDRKPYRSGERAGLFVMEKLDPKTPGTDAGWIYGTIAPDGTVTGAGNLTSCSGCHAGAKHDRLFSPES